MCIRDRYFKFKNYFPRGSISKTNHSAGRRVAHPQYFRICFRIEVLKSLKNAINCIAKFHLVYRQSHNSLLLSRNGINMRDWGGCVWFSSTPRDVIGVYLMKLIQSMQRAETIFFLTSRRMAADIPSSGGNCLPPSTPVSYTHLTLPTTPYV